jgi:glutathione synthase/RimK-type ligase-like ATP-grasp enzyme
MQRLEQLSRRRWFRRQGALVQELLPLTGRDLRLIVAGGEVVGAVERHALPGEWRTNVALGAVRRPAEPTAEASRLALAAVAALQLDLAGVDLMLDELGKYVVLEVNGAVDFTEDYGEDVFAHAVGALLAESHIHRNLAGSFPGTLSAAAHSGSIS